MAYKNIYQRLGLRMSEEFQLRAEEKWIIEALEKIKNQRNCLHIERLHLESIKAKMKKTLKGSVPSSISSPSPVQVPEDEMEASTSGMNWLQNTTGKGIQQDEVDEMRLDDRNVNDEDLDLVVNNAAINMNINQDIDFEEDDEEEMDSDAADDMFIDMNMLMNGVPPSR